ncbi:MAG: iron hydrogenase small subunit [Duodenibacillus sp.]
MSNYQFEERPASVILGRRGLFKVVGLCAVAAGATGWAVGDLIANRNAVLLARQAGLYKDDKLCQAMNLIRSHENPCVARVYRDLGAAPMDDTMYSLLHTHYAQRSQLAAHH